MKNSKIIIAAGVFAAAFFAAQSAISSERSKIAHIYDGSNLRMQIWKAVKISRFKRKSRNALLAIQLSRLILEVGWITNIQLGRI